MTVTVSNKGTGQGSVISPLLANVYLHYVFDLWPDRWRRREATGDVIIVRYADDIVVGFEHEADAGRFWNAMQRRFEEFALSLNPDKTRLIEFGRHAAVRRVRRGLGRPETFNFLGFTFICGRSRARKFLIKRKSRRDRMRTKLKEIKEEMRRRRHRPIFEQGKWLAQVVRGYFAYHAVPTNSASIRAFRHHVVDLWRRSLSRRSQRGGITWQRTSRSQMTFSPEPPSFIPGRRSASPSGTQGRSRMPELGPYGSVRGAAGTAVPTANAGPWRRVRHTLAPVSESLRGRNPREVGSERA
jgi:hypothetical protein